MIGGGGFGASGHPLVGSRFLHMIKSADQTLLRATGAVNVTACALVLGAARSGEADPAQPRSADATVTGVEIDVLTIRRDKKTNVETAEVLPLAIADGGNWRPIAQPEGEAPDCSVSGAARLAGSELRVISRGQSIGVVSTRGPAIGRYSCSQLCVLAAAPELTSRPEGRTYSNTGFSPAGSFDETVTQYLAVPSRLVIALNSNPAHPTTAGRRAALKVYAGSALGTTHSGAPVELDDVHAFVANKFGDVHVFFNASRKGADGAERRR